MQNGDATKILRGVVDSVLLDEDRTVHFCMCNPPYFEDAINLEDTADGASSDESRRRVGHSFPKTSHSARQTEKVVEVTGRPM